MPETNKAPKTRRYHETGYQDPERRRIDQGGPAGRVVQTGRRCRPAGRRPVGDRNRQGHPGSGGRGRRSAHHRRAGRPDRGHRGSGWLPRHRRRPPGRSGTGRTATTGRRNTGRRAPGARAGRTSAGARRCGPVASGPPPGARKESRSGAHPGQRAGWPPDQGRRADLPGTGPAAGRGAGKKRPPRRLLQTRSCASR